MKILAASLRFSKSQSQTLVWNHDKIVEMFKKYTLNYVDDTKLVLVITQAVISSIAKPPLGSFLFMSWLLSSMMILNLDVPQGY
jgi:hypothetical protein